jgi:hypothetical protein
MEDPKIILHRLLQLQHAEAYRLPVLKPPLDPLSKAIQQFLDWLGSFLRFPILGDLKALSFNLVKLSAYCLVIGLGLLLVRALYEAFTEGKRGPIEVESSVLPASAGEEIEGLRRLIRESLKLKDFARAARWRWRLFLLRTKLPTCRTPYETFPGAAENSAYYALMFRAETPKASDFEHFVRWIADQEIRFGQ